MKNNPIFKFGIALAWVLVIIGGSTGVAEANVLEKQHHLVAHAA